MTASLREVDWPRLLKAPDGQLVARLYEPGLRRAINYERCYAYFSAFEDSGATLVQLAQIPQPLLERTQLDVIERPGRLLPVAGNKGYGRSAVKQRDGGRDLLLADAQLLSDA